MKQRYLVIMISIILGYTYIFAIQNIDIEKVAQLYKEVSVPGITYEKVDVNIKGITENKQLSQQEITEMKKVCYERMIHSTYKLAIKGEERSPNTTTYNMQIQGLQDIAGIDNMRNKAISLFKEWDTNPKETISFIGYISGQLCRGEKQNYKAQLLKSLNSKLVDYYQDDYNPTTEAYYGYTPMIQEYTRTAQGDKVNVQITFTYNEVTKQTQVIIAFPFYNAPY